MLDIPMQQLIWRVFLKYGESGPILTKCDVNRRRLYVQKRQKELRKKTTRYKYLKDYFHKKYIIEEMGIKLLAKKYEMTYTQMRCLLLFLEIDVRKGQNIVTNRLRESRKQKAYDEHKTGIGWFNPAIRRKIEKTNARGVQGYFLNKSTNRLVWLRSTYEYIFAKWLNKTEQNWDIEVIHYDMGHGIIYRPDFFIYDKNFIDIEKIVEIKGYWDNNSNKALLLNEKLKNIDVSIIMNIEKFIENGSTYTKQLAEWKEKRITKNG